MSLLPWRLEGWELVVMGTRGMGGGGCDMYVR